MLEITNGIIKFTKGDSVAFEVELKNADGTEYTMQAKDKLTFTISKNVNDEVNALQVSSTTTKIKIQPNYTKILEPGKYCYDIELTTADGDVYTIVGIRKETEYNMVVFPEVTKNDE